MASHAPLDTASYAPRARPVAYPQHDEIDVGNWPVRARLLLMILGSLILWLGIAAFLSLIG